METTTRLYEVVESAEKVRDDAVAALLTDSPLFVTIAAGTIEGRVYWMRRRSGNEVEVKLHYGTTRGLGAISIVVPDDNRGRVLARITR